MISYLRTAYRSPIITSWLHIGIRTLNATIILPFALNCFTPEEISVWFLFYTVIGISQVVSLGFNVTFVRFLAYSYGGLKSKSFRNIDKNKKLLDFDSPDWNEICDIFFCMKRIFLVMGCMYFLVLSCLGSLSLVRPISLLLVENEGWISWFIVMGVNSISMFFGYYRIYIQGLNEVALLERMSSIISACSIFLNICVLLLIPSLLALVISSQIAILLNVFCWVYLARNIKKGVLKSFERRPFNKYIMKLVWESAWRSGITKIVAPIITHISGIIIAQTEIPSRVASFLLTQRLFNILQNFAMSAFNARLPVLARLRSRGDMPQFMQRVRQTMLIVYGVIYLGYICIIVFGRDVLTLIKSNAELGSPLLLILFSIAYMMSRLGAFQANMCNIENNVKEHIATLVYSLGYFGLLLAFFGNWEVEIFPIAMILGQIMTSIYILRYSYRNLGSFWSFEQRTFLPLFFLLLITNVVYFFKTVIE